MAGSNIFIPGKWKSQTFTGNGTFTVPVGVEAIFIEAVGGGQGGALETGVNVASGGQGAIPTTTFASVNSGENVSIALGNGGAGSSVAGETGASGGDTTVTGSFGTIRAPGAVRRQVTNDDGLEGFTLTTNGYKGARGTDYNTPSQTGRGGSGSMGPGGNGGTAANSGGTPQLPGNGTLGGGGGGYTGNASPSAGSGGSGGCIIYYKQD